MRAVHYLRVGAVAAAFALPSVGIAQSVATMTLTTNSPEAAAAFREAYASNAMLDFPLALRQLRLAVAKDPSFGLARGTWAANEWKLTREQKLQEMDRAFADATKASTAELLLVMRLRESLNNRLATANILRTAVRSMMPDEPSFYSAGNPIPTDRQEAAKYWAAGVAKWPTSGSMLNNYAYALVAAGDTKGAVDAAKKQIDLYPQSPNAHHTYADMLARTGDLDGAATEYGKAAAISPDFGTAHSGMARIAALKHDMAGARKHLQEAIAVSGNPADITNFMRSMAGTYVMEGKNDAADPILDKLAADALSRGDTTTAAIALSQMAANAAGAGKTDAAHALAARATAARPQNQTVLYYTAMTHAQLGHWEPAAAAIATARSQPAGTRNPAMSRLAAIEGYMAIQQKHPADALTILQKADTTDLVVLSWIARANADLGNKAAADAQYARINGNTALVLSDFAELKARNRAAAAMPKSKSKKK